MRWLLIIAPAVLSAQAIVQLPPAGAFLSSCGAIKRSVDEVQPYCYGVAGGRLRIVTNALLVITAGQMDYFINWGPGPADPTAAVSCGVDVDCVLWHFTLLPDGIEYKVEVNKGPLKTGKLTGIYGQPPPATGAKIVGTLVKGKCEPWGTGLHPSITGPPAVDPGCKVKCKGADSVCLSAAWVSCRNEPPGARLFANEPELNCILPSN